MAILTKLGHRSTRTSYHLKMHNQSTPHNIGLDPSVRDQEQRNHKNSRAGSYRTGSKLMGIPKRLRPEKELQPTILCSQQKAQRNNQVVFLSHSMCGLEHRLVGRHNDVLDSRRDQQLLAS